MAVAGRNHQRPACRWRFSAVRSNLARLDRPRPFVRYYFVFQQNGQASLATRSHAWLRRRTRVFLDLFLLDDNRLRPRLVRPAILSRHLFRGVDLVLRIDEAAGP